MFKAKEVDFSKYHVHNRGLASLPYIGIHKNHYCYNTFHCSDKDLKRCIHRNLKVNSGDRL